MPSHTFFGSLGANRSKQVDGTICLGRLMNIPDISVLVVCYNQEATIKKALASVIMQETSRSLEIVIADDCSTDNSFSIFRQYQEAHPNIRILPSETNLGITKNYQRGFAACRGRYVAVLEGDDYWIRKDRLQIMTDFLEANPFFSMAANRFVGMTEDGIYFWHPAPLRQGPFFYAVNDIIMCNENGITNVIGNFSTCVYRKDALDKVPKELFEHTVYDWGINIAVAVQGPVAYFPDLMSVYIISRNSTWNRQSAQDAKQGIINGLNLMKQFFPAYAECFNSVIALNSQKVPHLIIKVLRKIKQILLSVCLS